MIDGCVTVGPNAVLSLKREGYSRFAFSAADSLETLTYPGFWRVMRQNLRSGSDELLNSLFKTRYLAQCRKYCILLHTAAYCCMAMMAKAPTTGPKMVPRPPTRVISAISPDIDQCTSVSEAFWHTPQR